jgi:hypothetical protein
LETPIEAPISKLIPPKWPQGIEFSTKKEYANLDICSENVRILWMNLY